MSFRKINNDPYSRFRNNDNVLSSKINIDKSISIDFFSIVLSGDVTKLDQFVTNNGININLLNQDGINALHIILKSDLPEINKLNIKMLRLNLLRNSANKSICSVSSSSIFLSKKTNSKTLFSCPVSALLATSHRFAFGSRASFGRPASVPSTSPF